MLLDFVKGKINLFIRYLCIINFKFSTEMIAFFTKLTISDLVCNIHDKCSIIQTNLKKN